MSPFNLSLKSPKSAGVFQEKNLLQIIKPFFVKSYNRNKKNSKKNGYFVARHFPNARLDMCSGRANI